MKKIHKVAELLFGWYENSKQANKYTFVWNKAVGNYDRKLDEKIKNHLREIDRIVAEENEIYLEDDLEETA